MKFRLNRGSLGLVILVVTSAWAQELPQASAPAANAASPKEHQDFELSPGEDPQNRLGLPLLKHLAADQKTFWTAPLRIKKNDLPLLIPFVAFTGTLVATDSWLAKQVPDKPNQLKRSSDISNYSVFALAGITGGSYLFGYATHNEHLREAGFLSGEAAVSATAVDYVLKEISQRPRPYEGNGHGSFFQGGGSFPSEHTAAAWSIASVFAHEYPGPLSKVLAYGLASAVTLTRVTSKNHFGSDAFIGSALGWYMGRQIYRAHHDSEVGGTAWDNLISRSDAGPRNPQNMGSPYVPIDSWIYPLFDRLAAFGYVQIGYVGQRPWTRMACAQMLEDAAERVRYGGEFNGEAEKIYGTLTEEFGAETQRLEGATNLGASVDSVYVRGTEISGAPLRDGYHFGQTIYDDYGRPYGQGFNQVSGFTAHAVAGPLAFDFQGEYQHAPAVISDSSTVLQAIAAQDVTLPLANGSSQIDRFRLLSGSVAFMFHDVQFSFGKQSLWLGPGNAGPFLFSNNAEPIPMLRVDQTVPTYVPGLSRLLGPLRSEFFIGQLSGQHWIFANNTLFGPQIDHQPFLQGGKIGFKPTVNFEFGLGYTVLFGGPGLPVTWGNFARTFYKNGNPGTSNDAGDRRSTFDLSYRVPYLRDWLTIYADSLVEDEVSPLASTRPSMRMGTYFPRIPKVPNLELRMEGLYTDVPGQLPQAFIYWNAHYRSGYTNDGNLLASWIGRQGRGGQAWLTYWLTPHDKIELAYRHQDVDKVFLQGGRLNDYGARTEFKINSGIGVSAGIQFEQWHFPLLNQQPQSNVTSSVELMFHPKWRLRK